MAISLKKQERISLKKIKAGLERIKMGIEWKTGVRNFDVDISAFLCENRLKPDGSFGPQVISDKFTVFFNNPKSEDNAFWSNGDSRGSDGGGSELIEGDITKLDSRVIEVALIATINNAEELKQHFGMVSSGKIFLLNADNDETLAYYEFGNGAFSNKETAIHIASLYLDKNGWEFKAVGEGGVKSFEDIAVEDYGYPTS